MTKTTVLSYRELKAQLDALMRWFESDSIDVDEALKKHEEAADLLKQLEEYLTDAKQKIAKVN